MEIEAIDTNNPLPITPQEPENAQPPEQTKEPEQTQNTTQEEQETDDIKGVILHLLEGHYKAVPDIRLRINFYDQLAAIEAQQLKAAAEQNIDNVTQTVGSAIDEYQLEDQQTTEQATSIAQLPDGVNDAYQQFAAQVDQEKTEFLASESPSPTILLDGIRSAFEGFLELLQSAMTPPEPEIPAEETPKQTGSEEQSSGGEEKLITPMQDQSILGEPIVPEEPTVTTEETNQTNPVADFIEYLQSAFDQALAELANSLNAASIAPPILEPNGNGVAYEKFFTIYNEMLAAEVNSEQPDDSEPINSLA